MAVLAYYVHNDLSAWKIYYSRPNELRSATNALILVVSNANAISSSELIKHILIKEDLLMFKFV